MDIRRCEECGSPSENPLCGQCLRELFEDYDHDELVQPTDESQFKY
jgi:hypothetical protein